MFDVFPFKSNKHPTKLIAPQRLIPYLLPHDHMVSINTKRKPSSNKKVYEIRYFSLNLMLLPNLQRLDLRCNDDQLTIAPSVLATCRNTLSSFIK